MGLLYPAVAWGTPEDIAAGATWASTGPPTITPGQADPFGGTGATKIDDTSAAAAQYRSQPIGPWTKSQIEVDWFIKQDSSAVSDFWIRDVTAGANVGIMRHTWTAGVPAVAIVGGGSGTVFGPIQVTPTWWYGKAILTGLTIGNSLERRCLGAISTSANTGATIWYLRNMVLLDLPDDDKAWSAPRDGSEQLRSASGLYDRVITGRDFRFKAKSRWIPTAPRSFPTFVSGWEGLNEMTGISVGVQAMLKAGQEGSDLLWVPDRTILTTSIVSELVKPWDEEYENENAAGDRAIALELRNVTTPYPTVL